MKLIDKQELLDWIQNCWDWATVDGITSTTVLKQTMADISQLPTVEAIPKADYETRLKADIADKSVDEGYLNDWYISSVTDDDPKWTEAHIKELVNDFYLIPKQESKNATD